MIKYQKSTKFIVILKSLPGPINVVRCYWLIRTSQSFFFKISIEHNLDNFSFLLKWLVSNVISISFLTILFISKQSEGISGAGHLSYQKDNFSFEVNKPWPNSFLIFRYNSDNFPLSTWLDMFDIRKLTKLVKTVNILIIIFILLINFFQKSIFLIKFP